MKIIEVIKNNKAKIIKRGIIVLASVSGMLIANYLINKKNEETSEDEIVLIEENELENLGEIENELVEEEEE